MKLLNEVATVEKTIARKRDELKLLVDSQCNERMLELDKLKEESLEGIEARKNEIDRHILILESGQMYRDDILNKGSSYDIIRTINNVLERRDEMVKPPNQSRSNNLKRTVMLDSSDDTESREFIQAALGKSKQ